jgi:hypothetical protein
MVFRLTSGASARIEIATLLAAVLLAASCYSFRGGGGFPSHIRTVYIEPFDNDTDRFELDQLLFRQLTDQLPRSLGLRLGSEQVADAVVRGRIVRYSDAARNYTPGTETGSVDVLQHQVEITVAVEIVDRGENLILWDAQSLTGRGEYRPQNQSDTAARQLALESLVRQIVDGAQSQW